MADNKKKQNKQKQNRIVLGILLAVIAAAAAFFALRGIRARQTPEEDLFADAQEPQSQAIDNTIEWKGKTYTYNRNLTNVLFLGIDKSDSLGGEYAPGDAGQSDCIMLLSLDEETGQGRILQINRNTMTSLDIYDAYGNYVQSQDGQIALQYAYNIGGESSSWATEKTVEELLFGLEIDGYFTMDMDAISVINDALGGVDVTMDADYTEIDPSYTGGSTVHLDGEAAERFLRYRDLEQFNSVEGRMHRQVTYITALIAQLRASGGERLYDIISPYLGDQVLTNLDADELNALSGYEYLTDQVQYLPGEMRQGEIYEEYYADETALQDLIFDTYYVEVTE